METYLEKVDLNFGENTIRNPRQTYLDLAYQIGFHNKQKMILNKNYLPYFEDLLDKIANTYEELEIKSLDEDILFHIIVLEKGL